MLFWRPVSVSVSAINIISSAHLMLLTATSINSFKGIFQSEAEQLFGEIVKNKIVQYTSLTYPFVGFYFDSCFCHQQLCELIRPDAIDLYFAFHSFVIDSLATIWGNMIFQMDFSSRFLQTSGSWWSKPWGSSSRPSKRAGTPNSPGRSRSTRSSPG